MVVCLYNTTNARHCSFSKKNCHKLKNATNVPFYSCFVLLFPSAFLLLSYFFKVLDSPTFSHSYAGLSAMIHLLAVDIVSLANMNKVTRDDTKMPTVSAA